MSTVTPTSAAGHLAPSDHQDLTTRPDLATTTGRVAPVRARRPVYLDMLPPCNAGCPAGENIQEWLRLIKAHQEEKAWRQLTADNPFPAIHGRVCYHPCEVACNRADLDGAVSIHSVERYLGDLAIEKGWAYTRPTVRSGHRVLVIGAGPAGLSAAYHLAMMGHQVEIHDSGDAAGGMMRYGIPEYRLPREVLDAEIGRLADLGVKIVLNHNVTDLAEEKAEGRFDAVFVAIGAHLSKKVDIPNMDASRMVDAVSFLHQVGAGEKPMIGRRVAVYGGGNTAMDAARVAKRLGAEESIVVYRRTAAQMPAHEEEREEAEREGVQMNWLRTITDVGEELTVEVMELDENGKPHGTGRFEKLEADTVILAVGQEADTGFLHKLPGMRFKNDVVDVNPGHPDDRRPRRLRRRRHRPLRAHRDDRHRPRQAGRPPDRQVAAPRRLGPGSQGEHRRVQRPARLVLRRPPAPPPARARSDPAGQLRRGGRRPGRAPGPLRGRPLPVLRQLLRVRRLLRGLPRGRHHQARPRPPLRVRLRQVHRLRHLLRPVPGARHPDGPRGHPDRVHPRRRKPHPRMGGAPGAEPRRLRR
ncbi:MAG: NAD(P)-binding protein [Acidipropionibacterium sp.]|nr:NAD(P)-binding protein [Acidipropionibacterium sp.]